MTTPTTKKRRIDWNVLGWVLVTFAGISFFSHLIEEVLSHTVGLHVDALLIYTVVGFALIAADAIGRYKARP